MVTGVTPDRVTTDGHDSYPRAIQTTLAADVRHRDSRCLNNQLEQDHRGVIDQAYLWHQRRRDHLTAVITRKS